MHRTMILLILTLATAAAPAAVIVVHADGSGDQPTIQAALDVATHGDIIELADGTFIGPSNRDLDPGGVDVIVRAQGGDPADCIIDCQGAAGGEHRAFRFHSGESPAFLVSGITVTGGYWEPNGGAVACSGGASPTFEYCVFDGNGAELDGGAIYCTSGAAPAFRDCLFTGNTGSYYGGAVRAYSSSPTFTRCRFEANTCNNGPALSYYRNCSPSIVDCAFQDNVGGRGGGLYIYDSVATISGCTFTGNSVLAEGGGIVAYESQITVTGCEFTGNHAEEYGGAIFSGGVGALQAEDCLFVDNSSLRGGAVHGQYGAVVDLSSCTLAGNEGVLQGSGVSVDYAEMRLHRVIISGGSSTAAFHCGDPGAEPVITCSDIVGNEGGDWTGCIADQLGVDGNITLAPWYCEPQAGDYTLHADSPCATAACGLMGSEPVACDQPTSAPAGLVGRGRLLPVFPNPSSGGTTMPWELRGRARVTVQVVSVRGERLWRTTLSAEDGHGSVFWNGRDDEGRLPAAGVYLVQFVVDGRVVGRDTVVLTR